MQVDKAGESSYPFIGCVFRVAGICVAIFVIVFLVLTLSLSLVRWAPSGPDSEFEEIERAIEAANSGRK